MFKRITVGYPWAGNLPEAFDIHIHFIFTINTPGLPDGIHARVCGLYASADGFMPIEEALGITGGDDNGDI